MRYKVGNEVMLRDDLVVYKPYKGAVYTEVLNTLADEPIRINWLNKKNKTYYVTGGNVISCDMIDHEKTAELHKKDKALKHYQGELEKIVEQRNNDDYTKALMKYGRVEGDGLDRLKPKSDKYARHKEITDYMHNTYVSKNKDYGDSFERTHDEIGSKAGLTRISDKFYRLQNIILNEHEHLVEDETVIDTLIDLANYAVMFAMELEEDGD